MANVFIFHGVDGSPNENWFPWLKEQIEVIGHQVFVPQFPTPEGQTLENWTKTFEDYKHHLTPETILVGHSLGVPFALHLLQKVPAKGAFFVAPVTRETKNKYTEGMKTFIENDFNWLKVKSNCPNFYIYHSESDPYITATEASNLAKDLNSQVTNVEGAGHFNESSGYTKFDLLFEDIKKLLNE